MGGEVDVLVVGAGPVGLTAAAELRRHGVGCRIVDRLAEPQLYAKAVGIQPRTFEVWEAMGLVHRALDAAVPMRGQLTFVDGEPGPRIDLDLPPGYPYRFAALPQYETERMLAAHLAGFGTVVERGTELLSLSQEDDHVRVGLMGAGGAEDVRARFVVGCDGAHSRVRRAVGLRFEGDAFPEQYMLGDVEVDWDLPPGYGIRSAHRDADGRIDDVLVCIPLPGRRRYRMSMSVPPELAAEAQATGDVVHGLEPGRPPQLSHIQAVLDRLSPRATVASALRWSSTFRISARLVDHYRAGRVFLAGDAAHIHPPTGAQGMNTGVQDAFNLAWKLALAVHGAAADGLLDSYEAERLPVGAEVVGRTVRHARSGVGPEPAREDVATLLLREAQLLVGYPDGPLTVPTGHPVTAPDGAAPWPAGGPRPGDRAPDCRGLHRPLATYPVRLFDLLRGPRHSLLLYAAPGTAAGPLHRCAEAARTAAHGLLDAYAVLAPEARGEDFALPYARDTEGDFRRVYAARGGEAVLVRPDGYLAARLPHPASDDVVAALHRTFAPRTG
ncbi:FAD-dependent monooxygenase [Kitasatospora sp. NPDC054939]